MNYSKELLRKFVSTHQEGLFEITDLNLVRKK